MDYLLNFKDKLLSLEEYFDMVLNLIINGLPSKQLNAPIDSGNDILF